MNKDIAYSWSVSLGLTKLETPEIINLPDVNVCKTQTPITNARYSETVRQKIENDIRTYDLTRKNSRYVYRDMKEKGLLPEGLKPNTFYTWVTKVRRIDNIPVKFNKREKQ